MLPRGTAATVAAGLLGAGLAVLVLYLWRAAPTPQQPPAQAGATGLEAVAPGDYPAFRAWLTGKGAVADSAPDRQRIAEAEAYWAEQAVTAALTAADDMRLFMPLDA